MPFERILAGVDFSPASVEAYRVAVELARSQGGSLHVLHAIEARPTVRWELTTEVFQKARRAIEQLVGSSTFDQANVTTEIASGQAFEEIVGRAREWRADLIVLGATGATLLEDLILGGTARQVVEQAPCSVLVVRPQAGTAA